MYSLKFFSIKRILPAVLFTLPLLGLAVTQVPPAQGDAGGPTPIPGAPGAIRMVVPLQEMKGVVSWERLAKVKQVKSKNSIVPEFAKDITALNDTEVTLQGFMMPLEPGQKQSHFLISVNPATCAYCLPAGPEGVVEVKSKTPVKYTFEPIVLTGRLAVLTDDPMGLYYRLTNAIAAVEK